MTEPIDYRALLARLSDELSQLRKQLSVNLEPLGYPLDIQLDRRDLYAGLVYAVFVSKLSGELLHLVLSAQPEGVLLARNAWKLADLLNEHDPKLSSSDEDLPSRKGDVRRSDSPDE